MTEGVSLDSGNEPLMVWIDARSPLMAAALRLRFDVFVDEQGVPPEIEVDTYDDVARHLVAMSGRDDVAGTLRLMLDRDQAKIGRVAVRSSMRGTGMGRRLMVEGLTEAVRRGGKTCVVASQVAVIGFYRALGFEVVSEPFDDAGIAHVTMMRTL